MSHRLSGLVLLLASGTTMLPANGPATAVAGENYAFLVSVKEYDEKELRPLEFTRNDILDFHQALVDSGYRAQNIVLMHDDVKKIENRKYLPEAAKIRQQLKLLLAGLEEEDSVIVALAGHGVQFKADNQHYFCPVDARLTDRRTLVSIQEIYSELRSCQAGRRLLLVDACRNDPQSPLSRSRSSVDLVSVTRPLKEKPPEGTIALFSCSAGQQSYEHPPLKHGIFFHQVLQGWNGGGDRNKDGEITFDELATFVKRETTTYARVQLDVLQTPHLQADFSGEWVLRKMDGVKPTTVGEAPSKQPAPAVPATTAAASPDQEVAVAEKDLAVSESRLKQLLDLAGANLATKDQVVDQEKIVLNARDVLEILKRKRGIGSRPASPPAETGEKTDIRRSNREAITAQLKQADASLELATKNFQRIKQLYELKAASKDEYDNAEGVLQKIQLQVQSLNKQLADLNGSN